ncbi:MAG: ASKHA domain-containing protein [bacterium]
MNNYCKVLFLPDNKTINVPKGTNLLKAAQDLGIHINVSCGGEGICGKCKVIIEEGICSGSCQSSHLSKEEIETGVCLACLALVEGDIKVRIPIEAKIIRPKIITKAISEKARERINLGLREIDLKTKIIDLKISPPTLDDNIGDLERIYRELIKLGYPDKCVHCRLPILKDIGNILRVHKWDVSVVVEENPYAVEIVEVIERGKDTRRYGIAIDIGTTSIVVYLIDMLKGDIIDVASDYNAQISCGDDVISRIVFSTKSDGLSKLNQLVINTINSLIEQLCQNNYLNVDSIEGIVSAGNTIMTHLFLGVSPQYIRQDPYIPTANLFSAIRAGDIGIRANKYAYLYTIPGVSSYIGGDIVAGVLGAGFYKEEKLTLFMDVGTNGEIVLGNKEWLISASCSAGPAFEGGGVTFGMRAMLGAIEKVKINKEDFEPEIKTIGQVKPRGICGSGIIDILSELFVIGLIDQRGKFKNDSESKRIRKGYHGFEYVLAWASESSIGKDVVFTEVDIDNIMRAKGAMYAGCSLLLKSLDYSFNELDRFFIAGGFGSQLDIEKAIIIGLLPDLPVEKFEYLGNTAIIGAHFVLLSERMREEAEEIAKRMTYMELSTSTTFMDEYSAALFLPHTDMKQFSKVEQILNFQRR